MKFPKLPPTFSTDMGLLVLRSVAGTSMLLNHGVGKIMAGPERWTQLGGNMEHVGISFMPVAWGFMAAFSESFGALLLVLGFQVRVLAFLLACTMSMAVFTHLNMPAGEANAGWAGASHALEFLGMFVALLFLGGGKIGVSRGA